MAKHSKKPQRGCEVSITIPTEPLAGAAKTKPVMAVVVMNEGTMILEYEINLGQSIAFRVGGTFKAHMERIGDAPDTDVFMDASAGNKEQVTVDFEHALAGPQKVNLSGGQRLAINPVVARRWTMSAPKWE